MPDFPIVDTHVHLSNLQRLAYPWIRDVPALGRSFGLDDFWNACGAVAVEAMVFMEVACAAEDTAREVEWVTELTAEDPRVRGMVAQAPLEQGDAVRSILAEYAKNPLVKGIRRLLQDEDLDFCLGRKFLQGLRALSEFDFSFDICIRHRHLAHVVRMVQQCPDVRFILDHIGKPGIAAGLMEPWKTDLKALADCPNVVCKISGMATEADHTRWTSEDLKPYFDHVIECFGFDRIVYGGDWFVSTLATTYPRWVETVDGAVAGCSEAEIRKLYIDNAKALYRL